MLADGRVGYERWVGVSTCTEGDSLMWFAFDSEIDIFCVEAILFLRICVSAANLGPVEWQPAKQARVVHAKGMS